jgi:hypothetical protein
MSGGSEFSDVATEVERRGVRMRGLAVRVADAGRSMALASEVVTGAAVDLAGVVDSVAGAAVILNAALVAGGSGCSKPATSSW